jgi:hypothetical protein
MYAEIGDRLVVNGRGIIYNKSAIPCHVFLLTPSIGVRQQGQVCEIVEVLGRAAPLLTGYVISFLLES